MIGVAAFRDQLVAMSLPRLVITSQLMGRPLGKPGDRTRQRQILRAAFDLLEHAQEGKTLGSETG